ncbi:MAG: ATP-grasp domain-containing protein, partial [Rhodospirillaceae bacterium]|nr:ATP-grasp domain-containing protein [Rhodospirillaceae bacterium]
MRDKSGGNPAILFVESPSTVCTLDRKIFASFPHKKIILVDGDDDAQPYFSDDDVIISTSFMDHAQLDRTYRWLASHYQVAAVLGFTETSVFAAAYLADKFGVEGIGIDTALRCRDKYLMTKALRSGGVRTPDYFLASPKTPLKEQLDTIGGFPLICKPLMGFAGCGVVRTNDETELQRAIRKITFQNRFTLNRYYNEGRSPQQVLVQRFIAGDEVAIDGFVRDGEAHTIAIIDKPDVSNGPYFDDRMHVLPSKLDSGIQSRLERVAQASVTA